MFKKLLLAGGAALLLSGCSAPQIPGLSLAGKSESVWKSTDAGETFQPKVRVDDKHTIASADVLTLAFHPTDRQTIYIGTLAGGVFKTTDGAETWKQLVFPPTKTYGLAIDPENGDTLYATGVYSGTGKIYRSDDAGVTWKEVYTEPGTGTVVTSLAIQPAAPEVIYAGTSAGLLIKSADSGETWRNVKSADGPITQILFDPHAPNTVSCLVFQKGMSVSLDQGATWQDGSEENRLSSSIPPHRQNAGNQAQPEAPSGIATVVADPSRPGLLYGGAENGLFRSLDWGKTWTALNIIESSKKFPIRSVAVNPSNPNEIVYASGGAFYKSIDGGVKWSTAELRIGRGVSIIAYDPADPSRIYFTLRKF